MSLVLKPLNVLVLVVKVQWWHSSAYQQHLLYRQRPHQNCLYLAQTLLDTPGTGEELRVFFCDIGAVAVVSNTVTVLETWASSFCVTRLGADVSSAIIEGLKGYASCTKFCLFLAGVAALSHASVKIFSSDSAICAMAIKQQYLFVPGMLRWSIDRFVHRLQFMASLTWKAKQCNMMAVCGFHCATIQVWCRPVKQEQAETCNFIAADMCMPINKGLCCHTATTGRLCYRSCR